MLLTSKQVAERGAPTFNAWVATGTLIKNDPAFLKSFTGEIVKENASFLDDKAAWSEGSDNVKAIAKLLGGGEKSGVAKILKDTSAFLKEQRKITAIRDSYAGFVTAEFVPPLSN